MAGGEHVQDRDLPADADRVADRRADLRARQRRGEGGRDLFADLTELGFDEISVRKGHRYLTVVVDHHTGRLVWAAPGRDRKTVEKFLDLLGEERCKQIELVSCDDADWITRPVAERCPNAIICLDPLHIVKAATDALDEIRRAVWNEARRSGNKQLAKELKGARFALWKNARNLTDRQQLKLASIQQTQRAIYRAYLLKEQLRQIYRAGADDALGLLDGWLKWARRCRLEPFVKLARRITEQRSRVEAALHQQLVQRARRAGQHPDPPDHHDAASATTPKTPSSPSRCCHSAASAHPYPTGDTTHGSVSRFQKGPYTRRHKRRRGLQGLFVSETRARNQGLTEPTRHGL